MPGDFYRTYQHYDAGGRPNWTMDGVGRVTQADFDALGRPTDVRAVYDKYAAQR